MQKIFLNLSNRSWKLQWNTEAEVYKGSLEPFRLPFKIIEIVET